VNINGSSRYEMVGSLTTKQFNLLDIFANDGPMELDEIDKRVFPKSKKDSSRRMLTRWCKAGIIAIVGKTEPVPKTERSNGDVGNRCVGSLKFNSFNIYGITEYGLQAYDEALAGMK